MFIIDRLPLRVMGGGALRHLRRADGTGTIRHRIGTESIALGTTGIMTGSMIGMTVGKAMR